MLSYCVLVVKKSCLSRSQLKYMRDDAVTQCPGFPCPPIHPLFQTHTKNRANGWVSKETEVLDIEASARYTEFECHNDQNRESENEKGP